MTKRSKVRYLETRKLADGSAAYYYLPPADAKAAGVLINMPLGTNPMEAQQKAREFNKVLDDFRKMREKGGTVSQVAHNTFGQLCDEYLGSHYFRELSKGSQVQYVRLIKRLKAMPIGDRQLGDFPAAKLTPRHADGIYEHFLARNETGMPQAAFAAASLMRLCRRMYSIWYRWERVPANPFAKMGVKTLPAREIKWTPEQIQSFYDKSVEMRRPSVGLVLLLCYELCQRPGDILQLKWGDYDEEGFTITQQKTGTKVGPIKVPDYIRGILSGTPRPGDFIVNNETTGRPYKYITFWQNVQKILKAAELPKALQMRDLRRTGADELADAGATEDELMSVGGWRSRQVVSTYVKRSQSKASNAMDKRWGMRDEKPK